MKQISNLTLFTLSSKELSKKCGIYMLSYNNHRYIGSSKNLYSRLMEHRSHLLKAVHKNTFLQNISNKYGVENLCVDIIEYCDEDKRIHREEYWIKQVESNLNFKNPVTNQLSEFSKKKLSKSIVNGRKNGKYKTKYDFCKIEQYDYFGNFIRYYDNKDDASKSLNVSKKKIQNLASGYTKGLVWKGIRLRYNISSIPVKKFPINPQYVGKHFDFFMLNENNEEVFAFSNIKSAWAFLADCVSKYDKITLIPKLKVRESGDLLNEDNPNPSATEM